MCCRESRQMQTAIEDLEVFWDHPLVSDLSECDSIMQDIKNLSWDGKLSLVDRRQAPGPELSAD